MTDTDPLEVVARAARSMKILIEPGLALPSMAEGDVAIHIDDDGQITVILWGSDGYKNAKSRVVDIPTALLILAGHAKGLTVDVGPCPSCGGTGYQDPPKDGDCGTTDC